MTFCSGPKLSWPVPAGRLAMFIFQRLLRSCAWVMGSPQDNRKWFPAKWGWHFDLEGKYLKVEGCAVKISCFGSES